MRRLGATVAMLLAMESTGMAQARPTTNPNPMDSIGALPSYRPAHDTATLLTPARIDRLAGARAPAWRAYLERSGARHLADTLAMRRELTAAGMTTMTRGPYAADFVMTTSMTSRWLATDSAQRMAEIILSFQAPNGGWSKHVDFTQHVRRPGESYFTESNAWEWISTVDNGATTEEMRFLAAVNAVRPDGRDVDAFRGGIEFLLAAQYPNGCFPQIYPLEGSYHDAATFNDDATVHALRMLQQIGRGEFEFVPSADRRRAVRAVDAGVECILDAQAIDGGRLAGWGQQHDPLALTPTSARSYELTSLGAQESAAIVDLLMSLDAPSDGVVRAVYAATDWLRGIPIGGFAYEKYQLIKRDGAPLLWGRMYELGTGRIIMANRDGVTLDDWNNLTDRRTGYAWYTTRPAATLAAFDRWSVGHPRSR